MWNRRLPAIVWTIMLLVLCLMPGRWLRAEQDKSVGIPHLDKVVHLTLFAGFGLFWVRADRTSNRVARIVAIGIVLAVATELGQGLAIIGRDPDAWDALADILGLFLGLGAARRLYPARVESEPVSVLG